MIAERPAGRRGRLRLPRISARLGALLALAVVVIGCAFLWFRDSSFVTVRRVRVTGLSGPDVPQIRDALTAAARQMTTLDVDMSRLDNSVAEYGDVRTLQVDTSFPHGMTIHVVEEVPVARVQDGGRSLPVTAHGTLITGPIGHTGVLPSIPVPSVPDGGRLPTSGARDAALVLGAAPYAFLAHVQSATTTSAHGVVIQLRSGPQVYFGSASDLAAKWDALIAVLADGGSQGADYIDVVDPTRPAEGVGGSAAAQIEAAAVTDGTAGAASAP